MPINPNYIAGLSEYQTRRQESLIRQSQKEYAKEGIVEARPKVSDAKTPRSSHVAKFEKKYGFKITDKSKVRKEFPDTDVDKIIAKGIGAYGSSGSRPNTTPHAWANARLASVLTGGKALKVDKDLVGHVSRAKINS